MQAWLTPSASTLLESPDCRKIEVAGDLWLYVTGALAELGKDENWESFGDATIEDTAQYFRDAVDVYGNSQCGGGMVIIDPKMTVVDSQSSFLENVWNVPRENFPEGVTAVLYAVEWTLDTSGVMTMGGLGGGLGLKGASSRSVTPETGFFQFLCPMGIVSTRISITGGGTWSLKVYAVAYM